MCDRVGMPCSALLAVEACVLQMKHAAHHRLQVCGGWSACLLSAPPACLPACDAAGPTGCTLLANAASCAMLAVAAGSSAAMACKVAAAPAAAAGLLDAIACKIVLPPSPLAAEAVDAVAVL